jgi:hypothetical protein
MPGTRVGVTQVDRVADLVQDAIIASTERLLVADGVAVFTVFDVFGAPRIDLTSTACVAAGAAGSRPVPAPRRLPDEIRQLALDVRRTLIANHRLVEGARQIVIEIQMRGPRPSFDISYRAHKA